MTKLIDKTALVAEIEKRIKEIDEIGTYLSPKGVLTNLLCHLDTLEVKEADLEKEIKLWFDYGLPNDDEFLDYIKETAKHFYKLGLKTQKEG